MDLGTSLTWCIGILTFGGLVLAFLRFFRKNNSGNPKNETLRQVEKWAKREFVTKDTCDGNVKRFEEVIKLTTKNLSKEITTLGTNIQVNLDDIKSRLP